MDTNDLAPITLFTYNRPEHTRKTLNALAKNDLAEQSQLFIFCDGPKSDATGDDIKKIEQVRELVDAYDWPGNKSVIKRDKNWGLADSIVNGVTEIVDEYGKIIVLEDDLIVSSTFLSFMNEALSIYKTSNRVYQISGYMVPHRLPLKKVRFLRAPGSWGWGTWKDRWNGFTLDDDIALNSVEKSKIEKFNIDGSYPHYKHLKKNYLNEMDSWAVKWYAHIFKSRGICMYPSKSLVRNIGHDSSGVHCKGINQNVYGNQKVHKLKKIKYKKPKESDFLVMMFKVFYFQRKVIRLKDILKYFKRSLRNA